MTSGNIKKKLEELTREALSAFAREKGLDAGDAEIIIEEPKVKEFGDYATNAAMRSARIFRMNPMKIAEEIRDRMSGAAFLSEVTAVPPGFVNFRLAAEAGGAVLKRIHEQAGAFGRSDLGQGKKVLVEFMSANPTGPLHIGHARNAFLGDAAARCLEAAGYDVTREYYYNDAGVQMKKLGSSLKARYLQALGEDVPLPEDGYKGAYMKDVARALVAAEGDAWKNEESLRPFTIFASDRIIDLIEKDMKELGVHFDNWFSESSLHEDGKVEETLRLLREKDMLYDQDGAVWLRSERFGDEKDRVVVKSDGEPTYLAPDVAYHRDKYERGFEELINVFGGDHHGYVSRLKAGVQALGYDPETLHCIVFQMVTLLKGGERIKLSTRAGKFITLKEAAEELGADVTRFFFLMRSADSQMIFDWELAKDHSMKNPVYYVHYAHARCCSVFRKTEELGIGWDGPGDADLSLLTLEEERETLKILDRYPEIVRLCAENLAPHHAAEYLRELAGAFHSLFSLGTKEPEKRFIVPEDPALTKARLTLVSGIRRVLANALALIGVKPRDRMESLREEA